jgi:hypothetical protein
MTQKLLPVDLPQADSGLASEDLKPVLSELKNLLESARLSIAAVLDTRLERLKKSDDLVVSVDKRLNEILDHFETKPLKIKEQVEQELAVPLKGLVESYAKLDQQVKSLLLRIEQKTGSTQWALYVALFTLGFMGGLLTLCLGHFLGWL